VLGSAWLRGWPAARLDTFDDLDFPGETGEPALVDVVLVTGREVTDVDPGGHFDLRSAEGDLLVAPGTVSAMTEQPMTLDQFAPPAAVRRRRRWLLPTAIAVAVLVVVAGGALAVWRLTSAGTLKVSGTVTIGRGGFERAGGDYLGATETSCSATGGYGDIRQGAQVVVSDAEGTTIALGVLGAGAADLEGDGRARSCTWPFTVDGVPTGHAFYGVEVSKRGRIQFTERELGEPLRLSLGSG
jgi:hypothetical protein